MKNTNELKQQLAETIRNYNAKGWSPATSTNYSLKTDDNQIWVSRSGVDKALFTENDFITVDKNGKADGECADQKPSAETKIHVRIYEMFPETKVILHSHSVYPVLISQWFANDFAVNGYEVQKGFDGQDSHLAQLHIPIFDNTQDMDAFSEELKRNKASIQHHCFLIRKHGTYAWGKNLFEAKRHLETLEYLCQCEYMMVAHNLPMN